MRLLIIVLLVCGQTMAQKSRYCVPVNFTLENVDTVKTMLFKLRLESDTIAEIKFESMIYVQYKSHKKYFVNLPQNAFYLVVFTFPDNSHIELFVQTSDTNTKPINTIIDKNSNIVPNTYYNKSKSTYYIKGEPRSKVFYAGTKTIKW